MEWNFNWNEWGSSDSKDAKDKTVELIRKQIFFVLIVDIWLQLNHFILDSMLIFIYNQFPTFVHIADLTIES